MAISSLTICIIETVKLLNIWECIDDANNCIIGGEQKQKVIANFATLRIKLDEVASYQIKFGEEGRAVSERRDIMDEIDNRMPDIQQIIFETRQLIGRVQIAINGKQEKLGAHQKDLKVGIVGTGAQFALNAFQFGFAVNTAGMLMTTICSAALTVHAMVLGAQVYTKTVTQETIEKCRIAFAELELLDQEVQKMQVQYNQIRMWVKKVLRRLKEEEDAKQQKTLLFIIIGVVLLAIVINYSFRVVS